MTFTEQAATGTTPPGKAAVSAPSAIRVYTQLSIVLPNLQSRAERMLPCLINLIPHPHHLLPFKPDSFPQTRKSVDDHRTILAISRQLCPWRSPLNNKNLPFRDIATCPHCHLRQFVRLDTKCPRCRQPLGITYCEFSFPSSEQRSISLRDVGRRQIVGAIIQELRKKQGVTQSFLANQLNTHRTHLSRIEQARLLPRSDFLLRCIEALGSDKIILRIRDLPAKSPTVSINAPH